MVILVVFLNLSDALKATITMIFLIILFVEEMYDNKKRKDYLKR